MLVYVPVSAFHNYAETDWLWFYSLNGVHQSADGDLAAQSGFEEWRALTGSSSLQTPDGGETIALLGLALTGMGLLQRRTTK